MILPGIPVKEIKGSWRRYRERRKEVNEGLRLFNIVSSKYAAGDILIAELLKSMRPHQWYKNLVIFVGIIFSNNMFRLEIWPYAIFAFIIFCLTSGSIYIINDIIDIKADRIHPKKQFRPLASGHLSPRIALAIASIMLICSTVASFFLSRPLCYAVLLYIFINFLYTFYLKSFVLVDVMVIALGFILRAIAGCLVINVRISPWLILCVFLMAFVLAFGKRRHELLVACTSRTNLSQYTEKAVESLMNISVAMLLISYALYSFYADIYLMITLPFAFYGVFRFVQLVYVNNFGGDAELILKDRASLVNLTLWIVTTVAILYGRNYEI